MHPWILTIAVVASLTSHTLLAETPAVAAGLSPATRAQAKVAVRKGLDYLQGLQHDNGAWSNTNFPALTAFGVWAFSRSDHPATPDILPPALAFLQSKQVQDGLHAGAIFQEVQGRKGGGLPNYNTAIALAALAAVNDPAFLPVILKGREFLARGQYLGSEEPQHHGGMGYDPQTDRPYADLSNSYIAYEAMWLTRHAEEFREKGHEKVELDWKAAEGYIQRLHNDPRFNEQSWTSSAPADLGGFAYRVDTYRPSSGAYEEDGTVKFRSMPGMTYAGLLSYIYAGVSREDPRVQATVEWIRRNWQLERSNQNPEVDGTPAAKEGLFYMLNVMTKGMEAFGREELTLASGERIRWREEIARRILSLQNDDGSWINPNSRYWEGDPVLVTAYTVLALQTILGQ